jgi:hypothetical protein
MSHAANIARLIVEGDLTALLADCRKADGRLDIARLTQAFQTRFPDFSPGDVVRACEIAAEILVADLNAAAEGI